MIRVATAADSEALLDIARAAYGPLDFSRTLAWLHKSLPSPNFTTLLGERSFLVGTVAHLPWEPAPTAYVLFLAAHPARPTPRLEPLILLRQFSAWARTLNATTLEAGSATGYNLEPLFRRLAGSPSRFKRLDRYHVRFSDG